MLIRNLLLGAARAETTQFTDTDGPLGERSSHRRGFQPIRHHQHPAGGGLCARSLDTCTLRGYLLGPCCLAPGALRWGTPRGFYLSSSSPTRRLGKVSSSRGAKCTLSKKLWSICLSGPAVSSYFPGVHLRIGPNVSCKIYNGLL